MAYGTDTMYKDPRVQGAASPVGAKRPGAPQRTRGMMGMAAQARAGAPREGAPPVPVTSVPPKKKKKDPRAEAARRMFGGAEFKPMGYGGQPEGGEQQPPQEPTQFGPAYQPGTSMETQGPVEPLTYEKPDIGPVDVGLGPLMPMADPWDMPKKADPDGPGTPDPEPYYTEMPDPVTEVPQLPDTPDPEPPFNSGYTSFDWSNLSDEEKIAVQKKVDEAQEKAAAGPPPADSGISQEEWDAMTDEQKLSAWSWSASGKTSTPFSSQYPGDPNDPWGQTTAPPHYSQEAWDNMTAEQKAQAWAETKEPTKEPWAPHDSQAWEDPHTKAPPGMSQEAYDAMSNADKAKAQNNWANWWNATAQGGMNEEAPPTFTQDEYSAMTDDQKKRAWYEYGQWVFGQQAGTGQTDIPGQIDKAAGQGAEGLSEEKAWVWNKFVEQMSTQTGISQEELNSQLQGLENASIEQMAQLAQQMAARGLSFSGLAGAGMANIAAATMQAMVDLQYEHSKLALQDKIERAKMFMSMYGNMLSEEDRILIFDKMQGWEYTQWVESKKQKHEADMWTALNDVPALLQATGGWTEQALSWAAWAISNGATLSQVIDNLQSVEGKKVGVKDPAYVPEGESWGEDYDEGEGWQQQSGWDPSQGQGPLVPPGTPPKHFAWGKDMWDKQNDGAKQAWIEWSIAHDNGYALPPPVSEAYSDEEYHSWPLWQKKRAWSNYVWKYAEATEEGLYFTQVQFNFEIGANPHKKPGESG